MAMPGFYEPAWLLVLSVIPALAAVYYFIIRKKKKEAIAFSRIAFVKSALGDKPKSRRSHILFIVTLAAIGLLILGLADPHIPLEQTKEGVNVVLVIDDSGSMQATDYKPSRIEAAKSAADILLRNLDSKDYAGVVVFESGATTAAYLSPDKDRVREKLASVSPRTGQTAIGDGLALAIDMAKSIPNRKNVVILLSDGVNNAGVISPDEAIGFAKTAGIQVFTVGMGSDQPVVLGYDWFGTPQYAELDEATLKSIASGTGGKYFKSVDERTLKDIYSSLNQQIIREKEETSIRNVFFAAALILLCIEFYLRYGKGRVIQ
jgi:Ca-activated chloride channel family protein